MKRLMIFWGIENEEPDLISVALERKGDNYVVYAYADEVEIYVGDDPERYDLTYREAIRRRIRKLSEEDLDSNEGNNPDENTADD